MSENLKGIVLNSTPKYRSVGCPKWFCCSARPGRTGDRAPFSQSVSIPPEMFCVIVSRLSRMFVKLKTIVLNGTPKYRSAGVLCWPHGLGGKACPK
ncbi:MAG: hypothetical protein WCV67_09250 [Victivallaceae bacterium]